MSIKALFVTASLGIASLAAVAPASAQPARRDVRVEHRIARGEHRIERRDDRRGEHRIERREVRRDDRRIERREHDRRWR
jgi:hypothetical protein